MPLIISDQEVKKTSVLSLLRWLGTVKLKVVLRAD